MKALNFEYETENLPINKRMGVYIWQSLMYSSEWHKTGGIMNTT